MKKLFILILLPLSFNLYAEDTFRHNFNFAAIGFGMDFSETDYNIQFFTELLSLEIIHKYTNIGIGISPFKYWSFSSDDEDLKNDYERLSFLNFNINWDIIYNKNIFFGPFCSINYFFLNNEKMWWNEYIFTAGLRFSWLFKLFKDNLLYNFIGCEIGYRNANGVNNLHFNVNIDLVSLLYMFVINGEYGYSNSRRNGMY